MNRKRAVQTTLARTIPLTRYSQGSSRPKARRNAARRTLEALEQRKLLAGLSPSADTIDEQVASHEVWSPDHPADVNGDLYVSAADGLLLVNALNIVFAEGNEIPTHSRLDVSGDGRLAEDDFLEFVAQANRRSALLIAASNGADDPVISEDTPSGPDDPTSDPDGPPDPDSDAPDNGGADEGEPGSPSSPGDSQSGSGSKDDNCSHSLSGLTVDEGERFYLPLRVDDCAATFTVWWGDGMQESYGTNAIPTHEYFDDDPTNTPVDQYQVQVQVENADGTLVELATVITVRNVPPEAVDDAVTVGEDDRTHLDLTSNDYDPSLVDAASLIISKIDTAGTIGKVTLSPAGIVEYDARGRFDCLAVGETAIDTFRYTVHDDDDPSKTSSATVTVTIEGKRERYLVSYAAAGHAAEDQTRAAPIAFQVSPPVRCAPLELTYRPTTYRGAAVLPLASANDLRETTGQVQFGIGARTKQIALTPVDDRVIEQDEWYFFTVDATRTPDYEIYPTNQDAFFQIRDNEWRFVSGQKSRVGQFGPVPVEVFSKFGVDALLTGAYSMNSLVVPNVGSTADSEAHVRADNTGSLWRPGEPRRNASDFVEMSFFCDSQTGDIWRNPVRFGGTHNSAPLSTTVGMDYTINDIGNEKAIVVVDVGFEFLAGGTISKSFSPGLELQAGQESKGQAKGFIRLDKSVSYEGGVSHHVGDGFTLRCNRGPSN